MGTRQTHSYAVATTVWAGINGIAAGVCIAMSASNPTFRGPAVVLVIGVATQVVLAKRGPTDDA